MDQLIKLDGYEGLRRDSVPLTWDSLPHNIVGYILSEL